jgi:hypothetical protein
MQYAPNERRAQGAKETVNEEYGDRARMQIFKGKQLTIGLDLEDRPSLGPLVCS